MGHIEKKLEVVGQGRVAEVILTHVNDRIELQLKKALNRLKSDFRNGKTDSVTLSSGLAAYCALEDFKADLMRDVKNGQSAAKELHEYASDE